MGSTLELVFGAIPESVTTLDLSMDHSCNWMRIGSGFRAIPKSVTSLKLRGRELDYLSYQHAFQQQQSVLDQQYHYLLPTTLAFTATGIALTTVGFFANTPNDNGYVVPQNTFLRS